MGGGVGADRDVAAGRRGAAVARASCPYSKCASVSSPWGLTVALSVAVVWVSAVAAPVVAVGAAWLRKTLRLSVAVEAMTRRDRDVGARVGVVELAGGDAVGAAVGQRGDRRLRG